MDKLKVEIESSDDWPLHEAKSRQRDFVKFGSIIAVIQAKAEPIHGSLLSMGHCLMPTRPFHPNPGWRGHLKRFESLF
jgi:hypothetical protein